MAWSNRAEWSGVSGFALQGFALAFLFLLPALIFLLTLESHFCDIDLTFARSDHGLVGRQRLDGLDTGEFVDPHIVFISNPPTESPESGPQLGNGDDRCTDMSKLEMALRSGQRSYHAY